MTRVYFLFKHNKLKNQKRQRICEYTQTTFMSPTYFRPTYSVSNSLPNPAFSLKILTPIKIMQRNLNRSTFVVVTFLTQ